MFFKNLLTYLLLLPIYLLTAQNGFTGSKNYYIKIAPTQGFILEHRSTIGNLVKGYITGIGLDYVKPTHGNKKWHKENNMPEVGLSFNFINFANPQQLGYCFGLSPFIDIPLNKLQKKSRLYMRITWGASYLTKHYDVNSNRKNIAIGSGMNTYVQWKWFWHLNLNKQLRLEPGFSFAHASNGRAAVPNLGLNVVSLNLGLTYKLKNERVENVKPDTTDLWGTKHELLIWDAVGFNEHEPPNGQKYIANTFGVNYYYNRSNKHKFGLGFDISYDTQNKYHLETSGHPSNGWTDLLQLGPKLCYAYNIGRVSLPIEMGYYAISKPKEDGPIFHRIGIRYFCENGIMFNFTLKSHWAVASHFDYGIGYRFKLKKRKTIEN